MSKQILSRDREIKILHGIYASKEAELVAIYGRRRVGKTHLVRGCFSNKDFYCEIVGLKDGTMEEQLENFIEAFSKTFYEGVPLRKPRSWREAFGLLTKEVEKIPRSKKIVIFFDELPWMSTPKSRLLQNLDHFWNAIWSRLPNLKVILCGSAASWILENLINAKGGLHNRLTKIILLEPLSLFESKNFLNNLGIKLNDKQILDIYMVMGGIPFYLKQIEKGKSAAQNINDILFHKDGALYNEFPRIFKSLFDSSETHTAIIKEIAKHRDGISRNVLLNKTKLSSGGTFNKRIEELEAAGFIQSFIPYGKKIKDHYYRVIDEYSLFYLTWIESFSKQTLGRAGGSSWPSKTKTGAWLNWAGYAFEQVCLKHIEQIRKALKLDKIPCVIGSWRYTPNKNDISEQGVQIDLLLDRDDGIISICEIKFSDHEFVIEKNYRNNLINKITTFEKKTSTLKQAFLVIITTVGVKENSWYEDLVQNQVLLKDLIAF